MTTALSLVFEEDLHRDEIERFKTIPGCIGVSGYRNTLNVYFKSLERKSLMYLAFLLQQELSGGNHVMLANATLNESTSAHEIYTALREEATI